MQRCRKIEGKLKELEVEMAKKEQSRGGLVKMLEAYKSNPKMGNPGDVEPQINEYSRDIVSISEQIERLKVRLCFIRHFKTAILALTIRGAE